MFRRGYHVFSTLALHMVEERRDRHVPPVARSEILEHREHARVYPLILNESICHMSVDDAAASGPLERI